MPLNSHEWKQIGRLVLRMKPKKTRPIFFLTFIEFIYETKRFNWCSYCCISYQQSNHRHHSCIFCILICNENCVSLHFKEKNSLVVRACLWFFYTLYTKKMCSNQTRQGPNSCGTNSRMGSKAISAKIRDFEVLPAIATIPYLRKILKNVTGHPGMEVSLFLFNLKTLKYGIVIYVYTAVI